MQEEKQKTGIGRDGVQLEGVMLRLQLALARLRQSWRTVATTMVASSALLLTVHVVNGAHGVQVWRQKRAEDRQLRQEIQQLEDENAHLRVRIDRLKGDPEAIEHEVREKLHYARPGEVIYSVSPTAQPQQSAQPTSVK